MIFVAFCVPISIQPDYLLYFVRFFCYFNIIFSTFAYFLVLPIAKKCPLTQKKAYFLCNLTYNFSDDVCKKLRLKGLSLNANLSDIFYISSIKRERGTSYPFSRNPNFSVSVSF